VLRDVSHAGPWRPWRPAEDWHGDVAASAGSSAGEDESARRAGALPHGQCRQHTVRLGGHKVRDHKGGDGDQARYSLSGAGRATAQ
ncbi:unnamed protein product, partial [Symbiodinium necroappetens]